MGVFVELAAAEEKGLPYYVSHPEISGRTPTTSQRSSPSRVHEIHVTKRYSSDPKEANTTFGWVPRKKPQLSHILGIKHPVVIPGSLIII